MEVSAKHNGRVARSYKTPTLTLAFYFHSNATPDGNEIGTRTKFESCKRTAADDEFLLVRFQVFCILLGAFAVVSVRKQKRLSATLFDQRKLQAEQERKERERERESVHGIELGSMEETVPLTSNVSNPSMEVV
jgi:hypothetical protein